ncbi:MAG: DUF2284 domain-containing protein [Thermoplasmata archaeon]
MSPPSERATILAKIVNEAERLGATEAKAISPSEIVVDERVRLKCIAPLCSAYGRNLMCPPNLPSVSEVRELLSRYRRAVIVQLESSFDSSDRSDEALTNELCRRMERETGSSKWQIELHKIVTRLESLAFKEGCYLAVGLVGGECVLCETCVAAEGGRECRHPFEARPSMEAMAIDVVETCRRAGLPLELSSKQKVRWTGLVLLD